MAPLVLRLDGVPSVRDARSLSPNGRAPWPVRYAAKRRLQLHVHAHLIGRLIPAPHFARARITFRVTVPEARRRDTDNFLGGVGKALVDALVRGGVLPDDDAAHVEFAPVEWVVVTGQRGVEIMVEALGDGNGG